MTNSKSAALSFTILVLCAQAAGAQPVPATNQASLKEPRPLMRAADLIERRYGVPISYEDPEYLYEQDIHRGNVGEVLDSEYRRLHPNALFIRPADGVLDIDFGSTTKSPTSLLSLMTNLAAQNTNRNNPGRFRVVQLGTSIAVIPTSAKNSAGIEAPSNPILDVRVTFRELKRSGDETLDVFCRALGLSSGKAVVRGDSATALQNMVVTSGATNEIARDVLSRILGSLQWDAGIKAPIPVKVWRVLYGPGEHNYVLSVVGVQVERQTPVGTTTTVWLNR